MTPHTPRIQYRRLIDGRHVAECLTCMDTSKPTHHKPAVQDWGRGHIAEAITIRKRTIR